jgi:hypothetical protein
MQQRPVEGGLDSDSNSDKGVEAVSSKRAQPMTVGYLSLQIVAGIYNYLISLRTPPNVRGRLISSLQRETGSFRH